MGQLSHEEIVAAGSRGHSQKRPVQQKTPLRNRAPGQTFLLETNDRESFMRITMALAVATSMFLAAGCASNPSNKDRAAADRALEARIRVEMDHYGNLAAAEPALGIRALDGTVTITGSTRTEMDREMIDSMVRNTAGVVAVNDELEVMYPPTGLISGQPPAPVYTTIPSGISAPAPVVIPGPAAVPGEYPNPRVRAAHESDQPLAHRIVDQLVYDTVPAEWCQSVTITAAGGNVFLQGVVDNEKEHHAILSSVQHCQGVTAVYDQVEVR